MMHKEVELYVDNMIAKLRLNPAKCTFGVKTGKLLGFIVNQRGIKVNLDKVRAIWNMPPPRIETEVRGFLGWVNYIARFIS
ncbi:Retrovirus-related Pol polyprotein, partial [Mucuna pruriens]